jgi:cell division protein FtsW (lipid II flippase)
MTVLGSVVCAVWPLSTAWLLYTVKHDLRMQNQHTADRLAMIRTVQSLPLLQQSLGTVIVIVLIVSAFALLLLLELALLLLLAVLCNYQMLTKSYGGCESGVEQRYYQHYGTKESGSDHSIACK